MAWQDRYSDGIHCCVWRCCTFNRALAIWTQVSGIYLYIVTALGFAIFLGSIALLARKLEPSHQKKLQSVPISDTKESPTAQSHRDPRLTINGYRYPDVVLDHGTGIWREAIASDRYMSKGLVFLVQNDPHDDGTCVPANGLRAQLIWTFNTGVRGPSLSPAPWLYESLGIINIPAGTSASLLGGTKCQNYWNGWANPRTSESVLPNSRSETLPTSGLLFVRLSGENKVLFEAYLKWELDLIYNHPHLQQITIDEAKKIMSRAS